MKKVKFGFLAAAFFIALFAMIMLCRIGTNHVYAKMVDSGNYYILMESMEDEERYTNMEEKVLEFLPYDAYIMDYNLANAHYKNADYSKAQIYYEKCLEFELPQDRDCSVRINLTMTKIQQIDFNTIYTGYEAFKNDEEVDKEALIDKIDGVINELKEDREIITVNNCAGAEDDNGHSQEAESLKKDIDDKIKELEDMKEEIQKKIDEEKQEQQQDQQEQQDNNDQNEENDQNQDQQEENDQNSEEESEPDDVSDDREDDIKEQMEEKESGAREEREETRERAQEYDDSDEYWRQYTDGEISSSDGNERIW